MIWQVETEPEVKSLIDELGLRGKQQWVWSEPLLCCPVHLTLLHHLCVMAEVSGYSAVLEVYMGLLDVFGLAMKLMHVSLVAGAACDAEQALCCERRKSRTGASSHTSSYDWGVDEAARLICGGFAVAF